MPGGNPTPLIHKPSGQRSPHQTSQKQNNLFQQGYWGCQTLFHQRKHGAEAFTHIGVSVPRDTDRLIRQTVSPWHMPFAVSTIPSLTRRLCRSYPHEPWKIFKEPRRFTPRALAGASGEHASLPHRSLKTTSLAVIRFEWQNK